MSQMYDETVNDMFRVTFKIDTAAFEESSRDITIAYVLEQVAAQVRESNFTGIVRDVNGNTIGDYGVKLTHGHTMP